MRYIAYSIAVGTLIGAGAFAATADEDAVMPPPGSALLLELVAHGVQIYAPKATTDRVTYLPPLISDEPRPRAE